MLAKDEAHVLPRALASVRALGVEAMIVLVDAATTDRTREVARELGAEVLERPFSGSLADERNAVLDYVGQVRGHEYALVLDPDDVLEGELPGILSADVYDVVVEDGAARYPRPHLFRLGVGVAYEGVRHERAVVPETCTRARASRLVYKRIGGGWQDSLEARDKYMRHARDLQAFLERQPDHPHAIYMLAQSYRDAGEPELALAHYERRLELEPKDSEQRYLAALERAFLLEHTPSLGGSLPDVVGAYLFAHELAPLHAEPLFHLACYLRERGQLATAWHFARRAAELRMPDGTVHDVDVYRWKAIAELAAESYMLGDSATAVPLFQRVLQAEPTMAEWAREQIAVALSGNAPPRDEAPPWP